MLKSILVGLDGSSYSRVAVELGSTGRSDSTPCWWGSLSSTSLRFVVPKRYDVVLLGHETHFHFETQDRADETLRRVLRHETRPVVIAPRELHGGTSVVVAYN